MTRPAFEQQPKDGLIALTRGPTDHVAVVKVATAVNVRPSVEQQPDAVETTIRGRHVQRRRIVSNVPRVRVRAVLEQDEQRSRMADCQMQTGSPLRVTLANQAGFVLQEFKQPLDISGRTRAEKLGDSGR